MHNNIMAAGSRDRPPMLATGRYAQWRSRFLRYIDTRPNGDALRKCILIGPYTPTIVTTPAVPATEDSLLVPEQTTVETVMNMTPENRAHFESEKEAIHLILTGIGDEIYSTVDACQTAQEMWEAIERLQQASEEAVILNKLRRMKDMQKNLASLQSYRMTIRQDSFGNQRAVNVVGLGKCRWSEELIPDLDSWSKDEEFDEQDGGSTLQFTWQDSGVHNADHARLRAIGSRYNTLRITNDDQNDLECDDERVALEMHADLTYVESLEDEIDELELIRQEFSNMYDMLLLECAHKTNVRRQQPMSNQMKGKGHAKHCNVKFKGSLKGHRVLNKDTHAFFKKKELSIKLLHLEHLNRTALSKDETTLLLRLLERCYRFTPLFFWAEAIATACYTQNRSIIIPTHEKMAYHIINDRKPSIKHLHIIGCTCYLTRDGENLDRRKKKGIKHYDFDEIKEMGLRRANDTSGLVPQRQKASDYDNPDPALELQIVSPSVDTTVPSQQDLDLLFGPLYDEFFNDSTSRVNKSSSPTDNSIQNDTLPSTHIQPTTEPTTPTNVHAEENNDNQAEFTNPF
ncbi:hypothetical protein Tco_1068387 [Tanacetum coccineum]|uniref:Uncharacterized protein n=1 Tax=Tanacetum coccineum TaxID=301880 RepID=A0ABQ5HHH1_9ASTR